MPGFWRTDTVDAALDRLLQHLKLRRNVHIFSVLSLHQLAHVKLGEKFAEHDFVFIPVWDKMHYVVFAVLDHWIYYYDSLGNYFSEAWVEQWRQCIRRALEDEGFSGIKFSRVHAPLQRDADSCAAHVVSFICAVAQMEPADWAEFTHVLIPYATQVLNESMSERQATHV